MDATAAVASPASAPAAASSEHSLLWDKSDFSFHDILDTINPLQHLPVISTVYRWLTGDTIGNLPRVIGDFLFGGPIGGATGLVSAGIKEATGRDPGEHVVAWLTDAVDGPTTDGTTAVASNTAAPSTPASASSSPSVPSAAAAAVPAAASPMTAAAAVAAAAAAPAPAPPPAVPDHAPIPLYRSVAALPAASAAPQGPASADTPQQQFRAAVDRRFPPSAMTHGAAAVPLQLSTPLPTTTKPATVAAATAAAVAPAASTAQTAARAVDTDFSRRMLEALDKYREMQGAQNAAQMGPGSLVNLSH
jgi:hypothetical protein